MPISLLLDFGENFARLGFLTDPHPIQLEPLRRKTESRALIKECPSCHEMVSTFALICLFCGYEFSNSEAESDDDADDFDSEMGELFANDQRPKIQYLRSQIRRFYKEKINIDICDLFERKWGHAAPNEWHKGAVFGRHGSKLGGDTEVNRQRYLSYLYIINPTPKDKFWFKFHMGLEFGFEKNTSERSHHWQQRNQQHEQQYQERKQQRQQSKKDLVDDVPKVMNWWNILEVQPTDT